MVIKCCQDLSGGLHVSENDYDRAARNAMKDDPEGNIRWLVPRLRRRLGFGRWLDSQSAPRPGEPDRRCDTIAELVDRRGTSLPWALVIELFTRADPDAIDRLLEYIGRFRRELRHGPHGHDRYLFAGVLIFLTGQQAETGLSMILPGQNDVFVRLGVRPMVLADQDAVALVEAMEQNKQARVLVVWILLMKGGNRPRVVARCRALLEQEKDEGKRKTRVDLARVFADLAGCLETWEKGLGGLAMDESKVMRKVRDEGRKEGRKEGHKEGRIEAKRESVLEVLQARNFGEVPGSFLDRLRAETDLTVLSDWIKRAGAARTLDAFLAGLNP
jgi:hypothetical protein